MKASPTNHATHLIKQTARQQQLVNMNNNNTTPQRSTFPSTVRMTEAQACSPLGWGSPLVAVKSKTKTSPNPNTLGGRSFSAHQGQGKAPLKDVSNMKKPSNTTTKVKVAKTIHSADAEAEEKVAGGAGSFNWKLSKMTIKLNEHNLRLLNQVASQWRTGKGVCQTPLCMEAIRTCLKEGIPRADLANYVAAGLSEEVQAMELKRAKACATRIDASMKDGKKKAKRKEYDHTKTMSMSMDEASLASEYGMEIQMNGRSRNAPPYSAHTFKAGDHTFTVDSKYNFTRVIGSGAYGVVISAHDTHLNTRVAIKMVPKAFQDEIDAKRILREIKLLKHLKHDNIVGIVDMMPPMTRYVDDYHDVYIVSELMETDLYRIIYSKQTLSIDHVKYFVYQILRALKYIHSANVLHRDLKPSNLLVNSNCHLKVCDFGLARGVLDKDQMEDQSKRPLLTEYVVTRWYRAPEIMLACHEYDKPVDVWSTGCILAELLARKPYFPGDDYIDQVSLILVSLSSFSGRVFLTYLLSVHCDETVETHNIQAWKAS